MKTIITCVFFVLLISCIQDLKSNDKQLSKNGIETFANGEITTTNGIAFSNNHKQLFTSKPIDKKFANGKKYMGILQYDYKNGKWIKSYFLPINIDAYHPVLTADNKMLLFNSRSKDSHSDQAIPHNIWAIKKTTNGWSKPQLFPVINSQYYDSYASMAKNKNIYFNSSRPGGKGGMDIYVSKYINGSYQTPTAIEILNSKDVENDLVVDTDERFIIFNRYINTSKEIDMYLSYNKNNQWQTPKKITTINTNDKWELTPSLSADGTIFFFELDNKIMQINTSEIIHTK